MIVKNFEKKEKNTAELTVEASAEEFEAAVNKAYLKGRSRIAIPGFRKGKAPRKMIEAMYGTGAFYEDAAEDLYPEMLEFGVREEKLDIVGRPGIADMKIGEDKSLTVKFTVSIYPEVSVKDYCGIEAPKPAVNVTDRDVERELDKVREQNARVESVERESKNGDVVTIDFEGFVAGVPFEGGKGEDYDLELGSGTFIPGFEEQLVGKKAGESCDVNVTFPTEYAPELAGKDATFKVTVKNVKEKILPELDDEFAKDVSEFDTLDEYKASIVKELTEKRSGEAEEAFKNVVLSRLVDRVEGEVPDAMIEDHVDNMIGNFKYNISNQGMDFDTYLKMMGMSEEMLRVELRPTAEKEIKADLAYEFIAKTENFEVTDEDVEAEYKRLSEQYGMEIESIRKAVSSDSVRTGLVIDKAKEYVLANAKAAEEKTAEAE